MSNETNIIIRHEEPNSMDELPYGTACKVLLDGKFDLYVQINKNEDERPKWLFIGTFDNDINQKVITEEIDNVLGK